MRVGQMREHEGFTHNGLLLALAHDDVTHGQVARDHLADHLACFGSAYHVLGHELPIRIPAAKTSTPPTTTWNAAARKGVSM